MSVVGPRPHAVSSTAEDQLFWDIDNRYWHRHACRPGLTGLAQIQGFRGATGCVKDLIDRVEADLKYLQSWSFGNDIRIVFQTFKVIVHTNTY
jgi:lipopolysaccharide/colanic/teichoic acid biosynthesis glycosyltransferase